MKKVASKSRRRKPRELGELARMPDVTSQFVERGDLAHLALFLWATSATGLLVWALRELAASNRRFNDFVSEIARLNKLFRDHS